MWDSNGHNHGSRFGKKKRRSKVPKGKITIGKDVSNDDDASKDFDGAIDSENNQKRTLNTAAKPQKRKMADIADNISDNDLQGLYNTNMDESDQTNLSEGQQDASSEADQNVVGMEGENEDPDLPQNGDVENSKNDTKRMIATTFHVAIRFPKGRFSNDLNNPDNQLYQRMKRMVQQGLYKVYSTNPAVRQFALIKFSPDQENLSKDRRQRITKNPGPPGTSKGVVADFYLRFYTAWKHLVPLSKALQAGHLGAHEVSKKFVRAYPAETHGKKCAPDCSYQCYSYCDQGCCGTQRKASIPEPDPPKVPAPLVKSELDPEDMEATSAVI